MYSHKTAAPVVRKPSPTGKVAYVDTDTGEWITDDGHKQALGAFPHLAHILSVALDENVRLVYLTGSMPGIEGERGKKGGFVKWVLSDAVAADWHDEQTHYGDVQLAASKAFANPVIRKRHKASGEYVELHRSSAWFGGEPCTPKQMRKAMQQIASMLSEKWSTPERQEVVTLQATPNLTGRELWKQWLYSKGKKPDDYPPLPEDKQELIRSHSGQGRIEMCTLPNLKQIEGLYCLDGRFMYAASLQNLPCGEVTHDFETEFPPYARGRYRITYRVPANWNHLGLLMTKEKGTSKWTYPCKPGEEYDTWASWTEVKLAKKFEWEIDIHERLLWLTAGQKGGPTSPLDVWGNRLIELYQQEFYQEEAVSPLVKSAFRKIVISMIGGLQGKPRVRTCVVSRDNPQFEKLYDSEADFKEIAPGMWTADITEKKDARQASFSHPEWCAEVWGRCRTRMLHYEKKRGGEVVASWGALDVPREQVIAMHSDALYLSHNPEWQDEELPGNMRVKTCIVRPVPAPHSEEQLRALLLREGNKSNGE